jgi:hypothetical protein
VSASFDVHEKVEVFREPRLAMETNGNTPDNEISNPGGVERRQQIDPVA